MILDSNKHNQSLYPPSICLIQLDLLPLIPKLDPAGFQQVLLSTFPIAELRISCEPTSFSLESLQSLIESTTFRYLLFSMAHHPWANRFIVSICDLASVLRFKGVNLAVIADHICINQEVIQDINSPLRDFYADWERQIRPSFYW